MTADAANVQVALSGHASVGATSATAPTDSTSATTEFDDLGWISEEGVTEAYSDDKTVIRGNDGTVLRTVISGSEATLQMTLLESKTSVLELYHKGSVVEDLGGGEAKIDVLAPQGDPRSFVFDVLDGDEHIRIYVPTGEVGERGDIVYANTVAIGYNVTITCYPDTNGVLLTKFSDSAAWTEDAS